MVISCVGNRPVQSVSLASRSKASFAFLSLSNRSTYHLARSDITQSASAWGYRIAEPSQQASPNRQQARQPDSVSWPSSIPGWDVSPTWLAVETSSESENLADSEESEASARPIAETHPSDYTARTYRYQCTFTLGPEDEPPALALVRRIGPLKPLKVDPLEVVAEDPALAERTWSSSTAPASALARKYCPSLQKTGNRSRRSSQIGGPSP